MVALLDRQMDLQLNVPQSVCVVGCGGIGNWVALYLTLLGVKHLDLFDHDVIETHNLNRTIFSLSNIGEAKAEALKGFLETLRDVDVCAFSDKCTKLSLQCLSDVPDVIVDCTDKYATQMEIWKWCNKEKIRYVRVGVTTNHITVTSYVDTWGEEPKIEESDERLCGVTVPSWVAPVTLAASYAITKIAKTPDLEINMSL
jgi:tRNA A37 threonylcarbamoyladenosine dehydratase